jgi:flagellar biosynthesis protein
MPAYRDDPQPTPEPHPADTTVEQPSVEAAEPRQAAALEYNSGDRAPQVIASGRGYVAEQIIAAARDAGVPVREDPALAKALSALDLGAEVPEALYRAVAETLAWAYGLDVAAADEAKRLSG